jgi:hypothetical protein
VSAPAAHAALAATACDPIAHDDATVISLFVDLAARDVVVEAALPLEGHIELAWRKRAPFRAQTPSGLDLRHELLARAQSDALSPRTAEIATKLARRHPTDPVVLASLLAVARAHNETLDELARAALGPPSNPILDGALLETLPTSAPERTRIRARFTSLAATPAERALVQ